MKKYLLLFALFETVVAFSQVGIGTTTPSAKSILDLTTTDRGFLLPRMNTVQRTAIVPNATTDRGLQVYDTTTKTVWFWDGAKWVNTQSVDFDSVYNIDAVPPTTGTTGITLYTVYDGTTSATLPANASTAMFIDINGAAYTWDGTKFVTFTQKASTPWYIANTTTDAGNNKTNQIERSAGIKLNSSNVSTSVGGLGLSSANTLLALHNKAGGSTGIVMQSDAATPRAFKIGMNPTYLSNGVVTFQTKDGTASWMDRFAIDIVTGNVGIGIANPTEKLHINGNVIATGNVGIGVSSPLAKLHVNGNVMINSVSNALSAEVTNRLVISSTGEVKKDSNSSVSQNPIVAPGATSSLFQLSDVWIASYEIVVMSGDGCGDSFVSRFLVSGSNPNATWSIVHVQSCIGSVTNANFTATQNTKANISLLAVGMTGCADGSNSSQFNYAIDVNNTGQISITNNGNVTKTYQLKINQL